MKEFEVLSPYEVESILGGGAISNGVALDDNHCESIFGSGCKEGCKSGCKDGCKESAKHECREGKGVCWKTILWLMVSIIGHFLILCVQKHQNHIENIG